MKISVCPLAKKNWRWQLYINKLANVTVIECCICYCTLIQPSNCNDGNFQSILFQSTPFPKEVLLSHRDELKVFVHLLWNKVWLKGAYSGLSCECHKKVSTELMIISSSAVLYIKSWRPPLKLKLKPFQPSKISTSKHGHTDSNSLAGQ